jgi:hypothetical protein
MAAPAEDWLASWIDRKLWQRPEVGIGFHTGSVFAPHDFGRRRTASASWSPQLPSRPRAGTPASPHRLAAPTWMKQASSLPDTSPDDAPPCYPRRDSSPGTTDPWPQAPQPEDGLGDAVRLAPREAVRLGGDDRTQ